MIIVKHSDTRCSKYQNSIKKKKKKSVSKSKFMMQKDTNIE